MTSSGIVKAASWVMILPAMSAGWILGQASRFENDLLPVLVALLIQSFLALGSTWTGWITKIIGVEAGLFGLFWLAPFFAPLFSKGDGHSAAIMSTAAPLLLALSGISWGCAIVLLKSPMSPRKDL